MPWKYCIHICRQRVPYTDTCTTYRSPPFYFFNHIQMRIAANKTLCSMMAFHLYPHCRIVCIVHAARMSFEYELKLEKWRALCPCTNSYAKRFRKWRKQNTKWKGEKKISKTPDSYRTEKRIGTALCRDMCEMNACQSSKRFNISWAAQVTRAYIHGHVDGVCLGEW